MRIFIYTFLFFSLFFVQVFTQIHPPAIAQQAKAVEEFPIDKISYAMGAAVASELIATQVKIDEDKFIEGFKDSLAEKTEKMSEQDRRILLRNYNKFRIQEKKINWAKKVSENLKQEKEFLEENQKKTGVVTLPSGLQYKVIENGHGLKPTEADTVTFIYHSFTPDGKEVTFGFDPNEPVTSPIIKLIPAWKEALKLMNVGSTWELYSPNVLAFGERGVPPSIGPHQAMIFKLTLKDLKKGEESAKNSIKE